MCAPSRLRAGGLMRAGTCRFCGCTQSNACVNRSGATCAWYNETVCTACISRLPEEERRAAAAGGFLIDGRGWEHPRRREAVLDPLLD